MFYITAVYLWKQMATLHADYGNLVKSESSEHVGHVRELLRSLKPFQMQMLKKRYVN